MRSLALLRPPRTPQPISDDAFHGARVVKQTLLVNRPNLRKNALIHTKVAVCNRIQLRTPKLHNPLS
jgi:hypothetical protein